MIDKETAKKIAKEYIEEERRSIKSGEQNLARVVDFLKTASSLDDEDIAYNPDKFPFTRQEYQDVFRYLEVQAEDRIQSGKADIFPEHLAYFNFAGTKFIWRLLIGQGAALQLFLPNPGRDLEYKPEHETKL